MTINRRQAMAALAVGAGLAGAEGAAAQEAVFAYGVAAGDPAADSLLIWTHAAGVAAGPVTVRWQVASDRAFRRIVAKGTATALPARDNTLKVEVEGLKPGRTYYYRFLADKTVSPVGQARTLPVGKTDELVLISCCCAMYQGGYFNAYEAIAKLPRVDAVIHLGDYIYEVAGETPNDYGQPTGVQLNRLPQPRHACVTLDDYRKRFAQTRSDPQLQAAHARAAWICCWDDHDIANDDWKDGAQAHNPATDGSWTVRKQAAVQAFYEWSPIRDPGRGQSFFAINRSFDFGDLASFTMLETRLTARDALLTYGRDLPRLASGEPDVAAFQKKLQNPDRRMIGPAQEAWLKGVLQASVESGKPWQILGSGVVLAQVSNPDLKAQMSAKAWDDLNAFITGYYKGALADMQARSAYDLPFDLGSWDGYPAARTRLYAMIKSAQARAVVLSGDSHLAWVNDLHDHAGTRVGVEFGATAITSGGWGDSLPLGTPLGEAFSKRNPEVAFMDVFQKGFVRLTLTRTEAKGELMGVSTVLDRSFESGVIKGFVVTHEGEGVSAPIPV